MSLNANNKLLYNLTLTNQNDITFPAIFAKGSINPDTELQLKTKAMVSIPNFIFMRPSHLTEPTATKFRVSISISDVEVQDLIISKEGVAMVPTEDFRTAMNPTKEA